MSVIDFYGDSGEGGYQPPDVINDPGVLNDPGRGATFGATDPSARSGVNQGAYDAVTGYYRTHLGRDPENQDVLASWVNGLGGGGSNLAAVEAAIKGSSEAQAYAKRAATPTAPATGGGGSDQDRINALLAKYGSTDDPTYWYRLVAQHGGFDATGPAWLEDRIMRGDGAAGVRNGTVQKFQDGGATGGYLASGTNPGGYTDPSSQIFLNQLLTRLSQVNQPQDNSVYDLLKSLALTVSSKLQQDPYSAADEQALITRYRQPLTQARDAAYQRNKEEAGRKGYLPSSGLLRSLDSKVDQAYEGGIAQGANQMGVDAVHQKQTNLLQALQVLSGLSAANNNQVDRSNAMRDQAVSLAKMFPDFDSQRLDQLLRASGDSSSSSALSSLMQLGNMNLNTLGMNNANDQANSAAWGKLIAAIIGGL